MTDIEKKLDIGLGVVVRWLAEDILRQMEGRSSPSRTTAKAMLMKELNPMIDQEIERLQGGSR